MYFREQLCLSELGAITHTMIGQRASYAKASHRNQTKLLFRSFILQMVSNSCVCVHTETRGDNENVIDVSTVSSSLFSRLHQHSIPWPKKYIIHGLVDL